MERYKIRHNKCRPRLNKKGFIFTDLFLLIAIVLIMVVFFAGFIYFIGIVNTNFRDIGSITINENQVNMTQISDDSFGYLNIGVQNLRTVALLIFVGLMISIFITAFLVKVHPVFFIVYLFIMVCAVIFSFIISNVYYDLRENEVLGSIMQSFTAMDYIITYMPMIIIVIGFIAGILMFIGMSRDEGLGGGF